jgi:hypothetical protein
MGRANVYLPDDLERRVKAAQIPISEVCQRALLAAVEAAETAPSPLAQAVGPQFQQGWDAGVQWTASASPEVLLRLLREQRLEEIPPASLPADLFSLTQEQTLAWEAGFLEGARTTIRAALPPTSSSKADGTGGAGSDRDRDRDQASKPDPDGETTTDTPRLGDDSDCLIGVTLDGDRVSFDPHAAVRADKSPLFAILGPGDARARLTLTIAQDAASRGTAVVLLDLSGQLTARAAGLGKTVRVIRRPAATMPQFEDLMHGAIGLGGLWETLSKLSASTGLAEMFTGSSDDLIEPGYVTVLSTWGDGALSAAMSVAHAARAFIRPAVPVEFPRLLQVDLPSGITIPAGLSAPLGRIIRTAREQNAAVGLSAESAATVHHVGGRGAMLSTVFAFATSNPVEADRLRDLLGANAPILLNPPGTTTDPGDETWAVMRDLKGRIGQVHISG